VKTKLDDPQDTLAELQSRTEKKLSFEYDYAFLITIVRSVRETFVIRKTGGNVAISGVRESS